MKVIKVTLKQHTPLIHFQHNEQGATLRASEVKPKLDKFIIEKVGGGPYEKIKDNVKETHKSWFIDKKGIYALNYKLNIETTETNSTLKISEKNPPKIKENKKTKEKETYYFLNDFPLVLANMGGKKEKNELVNFSYHKTIDLIFIIPDSNLDNLLSPQIINYIAPFFANYNFGQRSNKGFGSFSVISIIDNNRNEVKIDWNPAWLPSRTPLLQYEIDNKGEYELFSELFSIIDFYWKYLKSGINYTKRVNGEKGEVIRNFSRNYYKSYLFEYLQSKGYTWEKRVVKTNLNLISVKAHNDPIIKEYNKPYFFARAHLGCPINGITYKVKKGKFYSTHDKKIVEECDNLDISISNKAIERIPSSIIFKPIFSQEYNIKEINGVKQSSTTRTVTIYILYNNIIIEALKNCPQTNFTFQNGNRTVDIPLFITNEKGEKFIINFQDLIINFLNVIKAKKISPINFRGKNILNNHKIKISNI